MTLVFYSHLGIVRFRYGCQDGLGHIRSDDPPTSIGILLFTDYVKIWPKKVLLSACLAKGEGGGPSFRKGLPFSMVCSFFQLAKTFSNEKVQWK